MTSQPLSPRLRLATLLLLAIATGASSARAQNPFQARQAELASEVRREGAAARGILPLLAFHRDVAHMPPADARRALDAIIGDRRVSAPVRAYARGIRARLMLSAGELEASRAETDALGYVRAWRVIGPFDNEGKTGFAREYGPETGRMAALDPEARFEGREREVAWREYPDVGRHGYVSFDAVFRPNANVCGYAETFVESARAQPLTLWVGGGGATRVWWNGEVVHEDGAYRVPHPDRGVALVGAHQGLNRVLVKACATDRAWGFYLRVGNAAGDPATGVTVRASAPAADVARIAAGHAPGRPARAPIAPFAALTQAAAGESASARALEDLARYLVYTGSDDPAEERARQLAARAADAEPTLERLALAASLATQRGEAMRFSTRARGLSEAAPAALLLAASLASTGPSPESALPLLHRIPAGSVEGMRGVLLEAEILRTLGLPETARARVETAAARAPGAPAWVAARAMSAGAAERRDELFARRTELLALAYDDLGSRRVLIDDAMVRGDGAAALAQLEAYRGLAAEDTQTYVMIGDIEEALGRSEQRFETLRAGLALAPEEAALHVALGRALLRVGQRDAGADAFRAALALRPQDASTRELLEQLAPEPRLDEAYAASPEVLLARRGDAAGFPLTILQDLSVNTVFESGLGSQYRQVSVQIHDAEGARQWQTYAIQYDPDVQRIAIRQARVFRGREQLSAARNYEQPLGEPWYRIYYDTRALVVVFPDLEPGDVVELQYRLDDVAPRNLFHDYYGDLTYLRTTVPMRHVEYVLVTPASRAFHFNEPRMPELTREVREDDQGRRVHQYQANDVAPLRTEPSMPGMTELVPYLHVSTYRTWEDVGRWYWGLIRDQLYADEDLRRTVRDLMVGATDTREKVRRVYDWVIRNTRYVALEFGIHGFLPYRVPDIVRRGFGDCKDKASLIYTMLREAGVDARIVLTRTRRNGAIVEQPASLAVFDHAIAYVPELDLYLDGTAEHSGIEELPQMDQGVMVLLVGPDDARLTRTPVLPAASNRRSREITLTLEEDGAGTVTLAEELRGVETPGYRSRFQAEGLRAERLARQYQDHFAGLELASQGFENLDDHNAPARVRFTGRAPQLAVRDGRNLRVAPTLLRELSRSLASSSARALPLELGLRTTYVEDRRVVPPRGWEPGELPPGGRAESEFGRLTLEVSRDGRNVRARTELVLEADRVAPERYADFRRWVESVDQLLRQRITLTQGGER